MTRFPLGRLVATPGALTKVANARMRACLVRHAQGDWGDVDADDKRANDYDLTHGGRLLSVYAIDPARPAEGDNRFWIITEADRSSTCVLLPDEY